MKILVAVTAVAVLFVGCHHPPPPPPPPPPPVVVAPPPPPPPPPPPKCEALSEACTGHAVARIRKSGFSIVVPDGWTYAQQDDATVLTKDDATLAVTTYDQSADPTYNEASRERAFNLLVNLLGVTAPKMVSWARPSQKRKVGSVEMSLWQTNNVTKAMKKGPMLVFGTQLADKSWILGAGFVPDDDKTDADKTIFGSMESIAPSPPATTTSP